jgi:hypothetical protein
LWRTSTSRRIATRVSTWRASQEDLDAWVDAQNTAGWWEEDPDTIVLVTRSTP